MFVQNVVCEETSTCVLHAADAFGNAAVAGGADIQAHLSPQTAEHLQTAQVAVAPCQL